MMANHMSRIPNDEAATGISDVLLDAPLFHGDSILEWSQDIVECLISRVPNEEHARRQAM